MGTYMTEMKLSTAGMKALTETTGDRREAIGKLMESLGGKLLGYYFAFGDADLVLLAEAPSHEAITSALVASTMAGIVDSTKTTVLMDYDEGIAAFKKANTVGYTPPGN